MDAACAAGVLVVAALSVAGCKARVTASDSRTVETFAVASGRIGLESRYQAGIGKASSSGKWGLGSMESGKPFAAHIGELTVDTGDGKKTEYLCAQYWSGTDFPDLDDEALIARLEGVAASSFRDREPDFERCVHESATSTLLVAPWSNWEVHPRGHEVVICTAGEMTLVQEVDGAHVRTTLRAGEYAINKPGVWHTADVETSATAVFITAGEGTEHRDR